MSVTVAGAVFDLHISCSDDFADGYGTKNGPKAGMSPVQYPVSAWKVWKYNNAGTGSCERMGGCSGSSGGPVDSDPGTKKPKPKKSIWTGLKKVFSK